MTVAKSAGDAALLLETPQGGNVAARLSAAIRAAALPGIVDIVPGASTVLVTFEPGSLNAADLASIAPLPDAGPTAGAPAESGATAGIDVVYDGPDLAEVARLTRLSPAEVIERHQAARYQVGWLGFSPGFGYLTGLDPVLAAVPRRDSPRLTVPAGSVAIAGGLAAVYPAASPGGWQLLGRTAARLWDESVNPPALLAPGMTVRFRAVDSLPAGVPPVASDVTAHRSTADGGAGGQRWVEVVQPGPLTTIQDLGRAGLAHLGVPRSGAADLASLRRANRLVGNDDGAACLEVTLGRLVLRLNCAATVALTGAPAPMRLTGQPAPDRAAQPEAAAQIPAAPHGTAVEVPAGTVLRLGAPPAGLRSYLAIDGGFDVPAVLGSRSADLLSGLGPGRLRAGDRLRLGRPRSRNENQPPSPPRPDEAPPAEAAMLRVMAGPRDDWFTAGALRALRSGSFLVTADSNRTGLRLAGPPLARARPDELPSEGVADGSLQVTHDGQPILLLADHPVTGGYPVIAVVRRADLGRAAQLRPGQRVRFSVSRPARGTR